MGHNFIGSEVHSQLAAQKIYFPPASAFAHAKAGTEIPPSVIPSVSQYAGQPLLTGQQAEAYADHFIAVHLVETGGGKTYAQLSTEAIAQPANLKLAAQVTTVFKGETLRGSLLNAYAFGTMATIAGIAAIAAFIAAAVMLLLSGFGLLHARRTAPRVRSCPAGPAADRTSSPPRPARLQRQPATRPPTTSSARYPAPPPPGSPDLLASPATQPGTSCLSLLVLLTNPVRERCLHLYRVEHLRHAGVLGSMAVSSGRRSLAE